MVSPIPISASDAIAAIRPGSNIFIGESCGEPQTLVEALVADKERLRGSRIIECRRFPGALYAGLTDYFNIVSLHVNTDYRDSIKSGLVDFLCLKLYEMGRVFQSSLPVDVALIQVAPPVNNQCSLSVGTGFTMEAAQVAKLVIAEVNDKMPRTYGNNSLPYDRFQYVVETSRQILQFIRHDHDEADQSVGRNVAQLIDDGSVISLGIGGISESALSLLYGKRHLGIHTGMITDGVVDAVRKGVITNEFKNINRGKTVAGVAIGSQKLFDFVNENPEIEMYPFSYTHDIRNIGKIHKFITVNSAIEVDLSGQVNAESIGPTQISTIGGQADFIRGAALSKGGRNIFALSSTTRNGKTSKIVGAFDAGTIVSTPRYDVHYIVTEFGVAELWGKTSSQRANALISIAHPKFRDELRRVAKLI